MTDMNADSTVWYQREGNTATITLNRPDKLNAFDDDTVLALGRALHRFDVDEEAFVAVLCGNGRAFSTGADVRQRQLRPREEMQRLGGPQGSAGSGDLFTNSINWKPVITAVHGYVLGMAFGIILGSDLIVADEGTKFQITEVSRGIGAGRYWELMRARGGSAFATEIALTGRFFTAEEAFSAGLINRVAPKGEHLTVAYDLAAEICKNPPLSVRSTIRTRRFFLNENSRMVAMQGQLEKLYLTEDFHEAARAFVEKRPAGPFKGR